MGNDFHKKDAQRPLNLPGRLSEEDLNQAIKTESHQFKEYYLWLETHMPSQFFEEFEREHLMTIAHNLMGFNLQGNFIRIHFETCSIVLCLDSDDADMQILQHYAQYGIKNYQTFISTEPPPIKGVTKKLRVAILHFTQVGEDETLTEDILSEKTKKEVFASIRERNPEVQREDFDKLLDSLNRRFIRVLNTERLILVLDMFFRAKTRDHIQYEVRYHKDWKESPKDMPSMQIVLAWRNTPKYNFLYRLSKLVYRHNLIMKRVNAAYFHPHTHENILLMSLALHGTDNKAAWEATDIEDFLQELSTLKYFEDGDQIEKVFVTSDLLTGNQANVLRALISNVHQFLLHFDANLYSETNIQEAIRRHPELTVKLIEAFDRKFHPKKHSYSEFEKLRDSYLSLVSKLDTGNLSIDTRRKNVLSTLMHLVDYILKTNAFRNNKSSFCFRIDPIILDKLPFDRTEKFPALPFAIFFLKGKSFIAFHIRFKDLSRGGLRTIFPTRVEQAEWERINIFSECYNLAYTQQKKNKDIPEGGSKAVIFVEPFEEMQIESQIYLRELVKGGFDQNICKAKLEIFQKEQRSIYLYHAQRSFIYSLLSLINCEDDGTLKAKDTLDYYKKPEYLYLGPDENMHNSMIEWIADYSVKTHYKVGKAFISSKPKNGFNHKEFGVTSFGVNVYMHKALQYLGIDPEKQEFTIKISGGPDGDVGGNQIYNLYKYYRNTAKLLAITDISGTIYDPEGLDLEELTKLFKEEKSIRHYPPEKLHDGGLLLDLQTKKEQNEYSHQTLCYRKEGTKLLQDWLIGNDTHHLYSHNVHQTITDIFIPAGGRPRTLNQTNWQDFLDPTGTPTSRAIVEGANLYLTTEARVALEAKGVLIIKDSSANKGGVICSSLEVLSGLLMTDEEFIKHKPVLIKEFLAFIQEKAEDEADLILSTIAQTKKPATEISDWISKRINTYTYQILDYLEAIDLPQDLNHPLMQCLIEYMPPFLAETYKDRIITNIPPIQQKATISCYIASRIVYNKGLSWTPSIVDVLPLIIHGFNEIP